MNEEIYAPPTVNPQPEGSLNQNSEEIASRGSRLGASLIDSIIMTLFLLPAMFFLGVFKGIMAGESPSMLMNMGIGFLGILIFFAINFKFLMSNGQTIGKKMLGIKIVSTSAMPLAVPALLKRYGFYFLIGQIPFIGGLISMVNVCLIFRKQSKCLHDDIAQTQVIKVK